MIAGEGIADLAVMMWAALMIAKGDIRRELSELDIDGTELWSGSDTCSYAPLRATLWEALDERGLAEVSQFDAPHGTTFSVYRPD